jgi:RimJ/RimL family protein N-acetyltransferase
MRLSSGVVTVVALDDRERIAAFCRRSPALHAYALGDLDDFFWPHTRWFGWERSGRLEHLALLYTEAAPPVLLAVAGEAPETMQPLLREVAKHLPDRIYGHLSPPLVGALPGFETEGAPAPHVKMGLADLRLLPGLDVESPELLRSGDLAEVQSFYEAAYPGTWFQPRMLATRRYVGIREHGRLVCVAGVHVWSPTWRVAALGNVATLPEARGRGLATAACARLCRVLLEDGIETIGLNVQADNAAALHAYAKLGFRVVAPYVETFIARSTPPRR